jgi:hypothetical protein
MLLRVIEDVVKVEKVLTVATGGGYTVPLIDDTVKDDVFKVWNDDTTGTTGGYNAPLIVDTSVIDDTLRV